MWSMCVKGLDVRPKVAGRSGNARGLVLSPAGRAAPPGSLAGCGPQHGGYQDRRAQRKCVVAAVVQCSEQSRGKFVKPHFRPTHCFGEAGDFEDSEFDSMTWTRRAKLQNLFCKVTTHLAGG